VHWRPWRSLSLLRLRRLFKLASIKTCCKIARSAAISTSTVSLIASPVAQLANWPPEQLQTLGRTYRKELADITKIVVLTKRQTHSVGRLQVEMNHAKRRALHFLQEA